jgi:eukaryotic-like serine/threonine-protein kinase
MTAESWREVERLLHQALQLVPAERAAFVANIGDPDLRGEVASLLEADSAESSSSKLGLLIGEAAQGALEEPSGGSVLGHFRVLREIGHGGMGVVYLAQDLKLERQVALKLLPAGLHKDRERLRRFEREARLAAGLNHSNIVTVFQIGEWEGQPFIATEFVEGETLAERLTRGPLPTAEAVRVSGQILAALAAAHQAGIVHRDLKPANVMVRPDGTAKVLDFGLARLAAPLRTPAALDETVTMTDTVPGQILGTPAYMAPEQWQGKAADARSDIYAFGCILYEMLTGRRVNPQRPPVASRALEKIISRCLEQDPAGRWQSAADLQRELTLLTSGRKYGRWIGIAAAGVALVLGAVFGRLQRTHAAPLTDKDVVVLSDFTNATGDPVFDGTLRQALAIQLEQSPFLKIMDDAQVRQDLRLMGRSAAEPITSQIAHDICVRDAAAAMIEGSIASLGKVYVLTLQAVNCKNGATLAREQSRAEDKEHVLQAVDKAATGVRAKLGESLASIEKLTRPLDQFTTSSLDALQSYSMGYTPQSQGQFFAAIPFFQRAVELDPNFAWAYQLLSIAYNNAGDIERSTEFQRKAFALIDRVSEFERLFMSARYYWQVTGELDKAIDAYRVTARSYPRYWGNHSELSVLYRSIGQFEQAVEESRIAVRLEPRVEPAHRNLVRAYIALDRRGDAKEALAKARALRFDGSRLHQRSLEIAYIEGDQAAAEREIQWYAGKPEEYMSLGMQAAYAETLGQRREASKLYQGAAEMARRRGLKDAAADFEDADALAGAVVGNCQPVRRAGRPALALALCGDAVGAERLAAGKSKMQPNGILWNAVQLPTIRAAIELKRGQPARAIELLESATPYESAFPEARYLRGEAYLRLEKGPEARAEFQKILDHKGANWGLFYALSYPALARATELSSALKPQK